AGFGDYLPNFLQHLPLNEQNLAWLIPSLVVLVVTTLIDKVKHKSI
ncbi:branched-chain amino acid transport system II carrier protein, partial [Acinetobacter baumannii]